MAELPIMPLKTDALLADTTHMTAEEFGSYCRILFVMWRHGGMIHDADKQLSNIAGVPLAKWKKIEEVVRRPLTAIGGMLSQKRLSDTWVEVQEKRKKNALNGTKGSRAKWGKPVSGDWIPRDEVRLKRSQRLAAAREKGRHTADEWDALKDACGHICVRCGAPDRNPIKDHITPIYQGGSDAIQNLQPLCLRCNAQKGPESVDHRPEDWEKRLANAWRTPGGMPDNQTKTSKSLSSLESSSALQGVVRRKKWVT